jgi:paraquat-inducible protein A
MNPETRHKYLIQALIVTSLSLLAAGAITPLLSTERFYFFSNTFSLASGLRQLVANEQTLIAVVIAFFSLCVPVIKAAVIWIAADEHTSRGPLLKLADRFGKWSMLEVFVAALVIISLKLGPVVDATLHYGAWLLAASVLLSGLASQLVAHEPHSRPYFSNPVTLTIGAVGGAIAATLLIGFLNPGLFRFEALLGTPEERCIQRTLRLDQAYAATSSSQTEYVNRLSEIDPETCPEDFREALADFVAAWQRLESQDANADAEPSLFDRGLALVGLNATRDDRLEDIEDAWAELAEIALEYGIEAPAK